MIIIGLESTFSSFSLKLLCRVAKVSDTIIISIQDLWMSHNDIASGWCIIVWRLALTCFSIVSSQLSQHWLCRKNESKVHPQKNLSQLENKQIILLNDHCTLLIFKMLCWIETNVSCYRSDLISFPAWLSSQGWFYYFPIWDLFSLFFVWNRENSHFRYFIFERCQIHAAPVNQFVSTFAK